MPELLFESAGVSVAAGAALGGSRDGAERWVGRAILLEFPVIAARVDLSGTGCGVADPTVVRVRDTSAAVSGSPVLRLEGAARLSISVDALTRFVGAVPARAIAEDRLLPLAADTYLDHLRLIDDLRRGATDPDAVERGALDIAARVLGATASCHTAFARTVSPRQRDLTASVKLLAAAAPGERLRVMSLASHLGCSTFHLCHTFRDVEGTTIGAYHQQLRLRMAARRVLDAPGSPLADLALEFGFSSHSHFTAAFRKTFGTTPSALAGSRRIAC